MSSFAEFRATRNSKASRSFISSQNHDIGEKPSNSKKLPSQQQVSRPTTEVLGVKTPETGHPSQASTQDDAPGTTEESGSIQTISPDTISPRPSIPTNVVPTAGLYREMPSTIEIRSTEKAGRGLWAKTEYKPGTILISTQPHVATLSNQHLFSHCSACFAPTLPSGLKRCTQCQTIMYCNAACQTRDWSLHKRECSALQSWAKSAPSPELSVPSDAVRSLARILWRKQKAGSESASAKEIDGMQSHRKNLQPSSYEVHAHLSQALIRYLGLSSPDELDSYGFSSVSDLVDLVSRFIINTFTITSPTLAPLGASVSPLAALINHSCEPNAAIVFPRASLEPGKNEPILQVIALKPILPNEEVTAAYVDVTLPRHLRRKELKETYHFTCQCSLCSRPFDIDPRDCMLCPKKCGGKCPLPTEENDLVRCTTCKSVVSDTDAVLDAVRLGTEALEKATKVQLTDPGKALQLTSKLTPILLSAGVALSSHPVLALSRLHQTLVISALESSSNTNIATSPAQAQENLDEAIQIATRSVTGLHDVLTYGHPVRGIGLAELGKLLAVDEPNTESTTVKSQELELRGTESVEVQKYPPSGPQRLKLACQTLIRARNELMVGFGHSHEGGLVGKEIRDLIASLEKELQVWNKRVREALEDTKHGN